MEEQRPIGYYVHHQGRGHLTRAGVVTRRLPAATVLSSLPDEGWTPWVDLPLDTGGDVVDPTAGGVLHWAPRDHPGLRARMARIGAWLEQHRPAAVVVDVSVEVSLLVRLHGVPLVVVAMPGHRPDPAHQLAYTVADRIVAPWAGDVYAPAHLDPHRAKVVHAGGISRYADRRPAPRAQRRSGVRGALLVTGKGGSSLSPELLDRLRAAAPGWELRAVGGVHGWCSDLWSALGEADVVVTHAGQGAVADVAAAGRPAVVVPEERPFDEQRALARALDAAGLAVARPTWEGLTGDDLDRAAALRPDWGRWCTHGAPERAAAAIREVAGR